MGEDTDTLQREVEQARTQLGETVQALAHKAAAPRRAVRRFGPPAVGLAVLGAALLAVLAVRARR
jgi:hypothetical protein